MYNAVGSDYNAAMRKRITITEDMDIHRIEAESDTGNVGPVVMSAVVHRTAGDQMKAAVRIRFPSQTSFIPPCISSDERSLTVHVQGHLEYASFTEAILDLAMALKSLSHL